MTFLEKHNLHPVINTLGTSTITGASPVVAEAVEAAVEAMGVNIEIDDLQRAACRAIAHWTGAEAGCVTSSAASGVAIAVAAAMTGSDLARIVNLPDTNGLRNEVVMQLGHDINFGARVLQMARLGGARVVTVGTGNHCDEFYLEGAINDRTAAVLFVYDGCINPESYLTARQCARIAGSNGVPLIVDAASAPDVRPFLAAGADLVIQSGHKAMAGLTSGLICGRKELIRACYLQNWGIGRAMKVGKEGIAGLMAAMERYYTRDTAVDGQRYDAIAAELAKTLSVTRGGQAHKLSIHVGAPARRVANLLREGAPAIWVNDAEGESIAIDLRYLRAGDAPLIAHRIAEAAASDAAPREDVPYHDLYYSAARLLRWPD